MSLCALGGGRSRSADLIPSDLVIFLNTIYEARGIDHVRAISISEEMAAVTASSVIPGHISYVGISGYSP